MHGFNISLFQRMSRLIAGRMAWLPVYAYVQDNLQNSTVVRVNCVPLLIVSPSPNWYLSSDPAKPVGETSKNTKVKICGGGTTHCLHRTCHICNGHVLQVNIKQQQWMNATGCMYWSMISPTQEVQGGQNCKCLV